MNLKNTVQGTVLALFTLSLVAVPAFAADIVNSSNDGNIVIGAQETHNNLYVAGASVVVDGNTGGDLTAAGGTVSVSGNVQNEATIAGGSLDISGSIGGNSRIAGGNITISGPINGDLAIAGGNINITSKANISGDLLVFGGNVTVDAPIKGNINAKGGTLTVDSQVGGNVTAQTSNYLNFGSSAVVLGTVQYKGPEAPLLDNGAKVPNINFIQTSKGGYWASLAGLLTLAFLVKLAAYLLAAYCLLKWRKGLAMYLVDEFKLKPWENLGYGLVAFIVIPILALLLLVTFVGYYLAFMLFAAFALMLLAANILSAIVVGYTLLSKMNKPGEVAADWQAVLIGVFVWVLLSFIPILGFLVKAIIFLMIFGAGIKRLRRTYAQS